MSKAAAGTNAANAGDACKAPPSGVYVGDLPVGAIVFHARFGLGKVTRRDEAFVLGRFGTRRRKLSYADRVAVWATEYSES